MRWTIGLAWGICVWVGCEGGTSAPEELDVYTPPAVVEDITEAPPLEEAFV